ncbi:MAG: 4-(cytidine 5'-diphospho)-2-C-methyl-D-erythritol kinase, partial [Clostridia bacterium]|nr:4-(cytidine 5'-diphospho)-2-C-methyl-D-erythritol kinase [Clostridia bacterium]
YFFEAFPHAKCGVEIHIQKRIPVAAGIAGGSSNAAGVLKALNKLCGINAGKRKLMKIGERVGADVPYCILGGTVVARGIGCDLERISNAPTMNLCIAKPNFSVSTPEVYKELDSVEVKKHPDTLAMIDAIETESIDGIAQNLLNVLEEVTAKKHPVIDEIKKIMIECGALNAVMSGSGPTVFGIFRTTKDAYKAKDRLKKMVRFAEVTKTKV